MEREGCIADVERMRLVGMDHRSGEPGAISGGHGKMKRSSDCHGLKSDAMYNIQYAWDGILYLRERSCLLVYMRVWMSRDVVRPVKTDATEKRKVILL